ncbi:hypothetical protein [Acetobacter estunensis]|uniref:hypothetical protein n=1 Tax=Acetobacter estunensis TaxID=104097 RepID=UPI001C2CE947|nr:hypothetical protein [Acetobacter estunensis]MBV1837420.1 hypothetical protein [Acetobacter estunensis]
MKVWSVWVPGAAFAGRAAERELPVVVPQTVRWSVLFLGGIGLAGIGARIPGMLVIALSVVLAVVLRDVPLLPVIVFAGRFALAAFGSELVEWNLRLRGYVSAGSVVGSSREMALLRYLDGQHRRGAAQPSVSAVSSIPDPFALAASGGHGRS